MYDNLSLLIVEKDPLFATRMANMAGDMGFRKVNVVDEVPAALASLADFAPPQVVVSDVKMGPNRICAHLAQKIRDLEVPCILTTATLDQEVYQSFQEISPAAFLLKPFEQPSFQRAINTALVRAKPIHFPAPKRRETREETLRDLLFVKSNNIVQKLLLSDILYIQAEGNYSTIVATNKKLVVKMSLLQLHEELNSEAFVQVHRNYLVRIHHIDSINLTENEIHVQGHVIPISRNTFRDDLLGSLNVLR